MTHLPFVAGAYGITIATFLALSVSSFIRLRSARRRLQAVETRRERRLP